MLYSWHTRYTRSQIWRNGIRVLLATLFLMIRVKFFHIAS